MTGLAKPGRFLTPQIGQNRLNVDLGGNVMKRYVALIVLSVVMLMAGRCLYANDGWLVCPMDSGTFAIDTVLYIFGSARHA